MSRLIANTGGQAIKDEVPFGGINYFIYAKIDFDDVWDLKTYTAIAPLDCKPTTIDEMYELSNRLKYTSHNPNYNHDWKEHLSGADINLNCFKCKENTRAAIILIIDDDLHSNGVKFEFSQVKDQGIYMAIQNDAGATAKMSRIAGDDWGKQIIDERLKKVAFVCDVTPANSAGSYTPFNIAIVGRKPDTPVKVAIIVDPKTKNDGFVCADDDTDPACLLLPKRARGEANAPEKAEAIS